MNIDTSLQEVADFLIHIQAHRYLEETNSAVKYPTYVVTENARSRVLFLSGTS